MKSSTYTPIFADKRISTRTGLTTLAIVGFAPTTRSQPPWDDPDTIIMGLNEAYVHSFMKRWDVWMQIHTERDFMRPSQPAMTTNLPLLKAGLSKESLQL